MANSSNHMASRATGVQDEHSRMLAPINGYQDVRLMTLEEAVKPILHLFSGNDSLLPLVWVMKNRCNNPADGLSQDESASIMLYTYEWNTNEKSLYYVLNRDLRKEERRILIPWFPYLRLLIGALLKLPPINDVIYRGVKKNMSTQYRTGDIKYWWGFSSCTDGMHVLESEQFCGRAGDRTIFQIKCFEGRNIKNHSYFHGESEILLLPGRCLKVQSAYTAQDGLCIIRVDEIVPEHELLKLPDIRPWRYIRPGICLLGTCKNSNCRAFKNEVIIPLGFCKFDVLVDSNELTTICPMCKCYVESSAIGFNECQWQIHGLMQIEQGQVPTEYHKNWTNTHGYSLNIRDLSNATWRQLIIEAKPQNS